jgi:hypothetical protein
MRWGAITGDRVWTPAADRAGAARVSILWLERLA